MRRPNFFMPGAPKCGTTAMASYLAEHPQVFMSTPKEPAYFNENVSVDRRDQQIPSHRNDLDLYLALYAGADERHAVVGEATTTYLMNAKAIPRIAEFAPDAAIVVMLRNPVDQVHAFHSQLLRGATETEPDFRTAWDLQGERAQGRQVPRSARSATVLQYGHVGSNGRHVQRLLEHFDRDQVLFLLFEDLMADAGATYRSVLDFLDLPDDGRTSFDVVNPHKSFTQTQMMRWLSSDTALRRVSERLKRRLGRESWGIYESLLRRHTTAGPRGALDADTRELVTDYFHDDVLLLQELIGRDLGAWLRPAAAR